MFEELLNLVKENAGDAIINNPAIPNEQNDAVCETATSSIIDKLKGMAGSGGLENITNMFTGGGNVADHPVVSNISSGVVGDLMEKFGLDSGTAGNVVSQLVPVVMGKLVNKTNDPNDSSFNMQSILGTLTGGLGGGILGTLKGFFGGK